MSLWKRGHTTLYGWDRGGGVALCIRCEQCDAAYSSSCPDKPNQWVPETVTVEAFLFSLAQRHGWSVEPPRCQKHGAATPPQVGGGA